MDIGSLAQGIALFSNALTAIKQAIDLLPDNAQKIEAQGAYERAEREFKLAEAESAQNLGYRLCRRHFPPEVMLEMQKDVWKCTKCGDVYTKERKPNPWSGLKNV